MKTQKILKKYKVRTAAAYYIIKALDDIQARMIFKSESDEDILTCIECPAGTSKFYEESFK